MKAYPISHQEPKKEVLEGVYVESQITLHENGLLIGCIHSQTQNRFQGSHVVIQIFLYDKHRNILWTSDQHQCGVSGKCDPTGTNERTCEFKEQVAESIMEKVDSFAIIQENKGGSDTLDWFKSIAEKRANLGNINVIKEMIMGNKITQTTVTGDNVARDKNEQNNDINAPTGIVGGIQSPIEVNENATVAGLINKYEQKKLIEIAQELTDLFNYFEQNNPPVSDAIEIINVAKNKYPELNDPKIIEAAIHNNPSLKQRLLAGGKAAYIETIKVLSPPIGIAIEAFKAFNNPT